MLPRRAEPKQKLAPETLKAGRLAGGSRGVDENPMGGECLKARTCLGLGKARAKVYTLPRVGELEGVLYWMKSTIQEQSEKWCFLSCFF